MLKILEYIAIAAATTFVVSLFALIFFYASPSPSPQSPQQQEAPEHKPEQNSGEANKSLWEKARTDPVAFFTLWLVIFTAVLSAVGVIQIRMLVRAETVAEKSAQAAKDSADVARDTLIATQRPWVSVSIKVIGPLKFSATEATIRLRFTFKNVGPAPANSVRASPELIVTPRDVFAKMKEVLKQDHFDASDFTFVGFPLFPGETQTDEYVVQITKEEVDKARASRPDISAEALRNMISPFLIGTVRYASPVSKRPLQTSFMAILTEINPATPGEDYAINWQEPGTEIPLERLRLVERVLGGTAE